MSDNAFEVLDPDSILLILKKLKPISVLSLCQTSRLFASYCANNEVFVVLMKEHYPNLHYGHTTSKQRYIELTGMFGTTYVIKFDHHNDDHNFASRAYAVDYHRTGMYHDKLYFPINGTKIRKGETLWLKVQIYDVDDGFPLVFESRSDAIDNLVGITRYNIIQHIAMANDVDDEIYEKVDQTDINYHEYLEDLSQSDAFQRVLYKEGYPNVDKESMREYFAESDKVEYGDILIMLVEFTVG
jgi:hypothetical protein